MNCDAFPESFARVVGKLGTSLSNRAHREDFGGIGVLLKMVFVKRQNTYLHKDYKYFL